MANADTTKAAYWSQWVPNLSNPSNVIFSSSSNREYRLEFSTNLLQNLWFETNQWVVGDYPETIITIPITNEFRVNRIRVRIPEE